MAEGTNRFAGLVADGPEDGGTGSDVREQLQEIRQRLNALETCYAASSAANRAGVASVAASCQQLDHRQRQLAAEAKEQQQRVSGELQALRQRPASSPAPQRRGVTVIVHAAAGPRTGSRIVDAAAAVTGVPHARVDCLRIPTKGETRQPRGGQQPEQQQPQQLEQQQPQQPEQQQPQRPEQQQPQQLEQRRQADGDGQQQQRQQQQQQAQHGPGEERQAYAAAARGVTGVYRVTLPSSAAAQLLACSYMFSWYASTQDIRVGYELTRQQQAARKRQAPLYRALTKRRPGYTSRRVMWLVDVLLVWDEQARWWAAAVLEANAVHAMSQYAPGYVNRPADLAAARRVLPVLHAAALRPDRAWALHEAALRMQEGLAHSGGAYTSLNWAAGLAAGVASDGLEPVSRGADSDQAAAGTAGAVSGHNDAAVAAAGPASAAATAAAAATGDTQPAAAATAAEVRPAAAAATADGGGQVAPTGTGAQVSTAQAGGAPPAAGTAVTADGQRQQGGLEAGGGGATPPSIAPAVCQRTGAAVAAGGAPAAAPQGKSSNGNNRRAPKAVGASGGGSQTATARGPSSGSSNGEAPVLAGPVPGPPPLSATEGVAPVAVALETTPMGSSSRQQAPTSAEAHPGSSVPGAHARGGSRLETPASGGTRVAAHAGSSSEQQVPAAGGTSPATTAGKKAAAAAVIAQERAAAGLRSPSKVLGPALRGSRETNALGPPRLVPGRLRSQSLSQQPRQARPPHKQQQQQQQQERHRPDTSAERDQSEDGEELEPVDPTQLAGFADGTTGADLPAPV
jgi:hypothetical protein